MHLAESKKPDTIFHQIPFKSITDQEYFEGDRIGREGGREQTRQRDDCHCWCTAAAPSPGELLRPHSCSSPRNPPRNIHQISAASAFPFLHRPPPPTPARPRRRIGGHSRRTVVAASPAGRPRQPFRSISQNPPQIHPRSPLPPFLRRNPCLATSSAPFS